MRDWKKYKVWQMSHELLLDVYTTTNNFPKEELFNTTSQLRRACLSVPNNIVEGAGRKSDADFGRFLTISLSSANEVEYLFLVAKDLNFLPSDKYEQLNSDISIIKKMLYKLIMSLKK